MSDSDKFSVVMGLAAKAGRSHIADRIESSEPLKGYRTHLMNTFAGVQKVALLAGVSIDPDMMTKPIVIIPVAIVAMATHYYISHFRSEA